MNELVLCFVKCFELLIFVDCVFFVNLGVEVNEVVLKFVCCVVFDCYGVDKYEVVLFV